MSCLLIHVLTTLVALNLHVTTGFNVDTENFIRHRGAPGSMFGFSVAEHRDRGTSWVLVGAPEAQTSQPGVRRGGAVYRCDVSREDACQEVPFDVTGNNNNSDGRQLDLKSEQWFGATLQSSGEDGIVVACAPRYVWFSQTLNRRDPVGTCYIARNSFSDYSEYSPCRTRNWGHHRQGSCQAGLGASISKDGDRMYIGAVGSWYWQGQLFSQSLNIRPDVVNTKEGSAVDDDSYLGYSVAVGDFGNESVVAVGMPRGAGLFGKVLLYTWNLTNHLNLTGEQLGSYFGYALCVSDLDGDGRDDLVVGAPLFTNFTKNKEHYETGRIYVYYQSVYFNDSSQEFHVRDGKNSTSRFGLSLSTLGDINKDGYGDIAVGAPYDGPEHRGAVYIFHGSKKGIMEKPSQVIQAGDIFSTISTFGFSLAGGVDLDENEYPDLVVGAYEADTAVYLRARPVVKVDAAVTFRGESKQLSLDTKACNLSGNIAVVCTELEACLHYTGVGVDGRLDFEVQFLLDTKKPKSPRMFLFNEPGHNVMNYTLRLAKDARSCRRFTVYIKPGIRDKLTPLEAEMRYSLHTGSAALSSRRRITRSLVPILDQSRDAFRRDSINIQKNCGPDNICIPDLKLSANPSVNEYMLGSEKRLELDVIVENKNEDSFETTFLMPMPAGVNYIKVERKEKAEHEFLVQCSAPSQTNNNTLRCDLGNPLPKNRFVRFNILLMPSLTEVMKPRYEFKMNVNSTNPEQEDTTHDNSLQLTVPIWVDAELELHGVSEPPDLHYNMTLYDSADNATLETEVGPQLVHKYTITNKGPSGITEAEAYFVWPSFTFDGDRILYLAEMPVTEGRVTCELVGDAKANVLNLKMDRKKKVFFEHGSSSSHNEISGSSSTSFSSSSSTSSSSSSASSSSSSSSKSSSSSSGSRSTQQGSQSQAHPDRRLSTLTDEERRYYEEERKMGIKNEEMSGTGHQGGGSTSGVRGESEHTHSYRKEFRVSQDRDGGGRNEDQRSGYGIDVSTGGAGGGTAGGTRSHSHSSQNFSVTWGEHGEAPHRYSNYSYSNWTSGGDSSAYGRGRQEIPSSHHSSSSSGGSRQEYAGRRGSSPYSDNFGSAGDVRHYSGNWSSGATDNAGRGYEGAGYDTGIYSGAGAHFTFSTETSDILHNIGTSFQSSHLSNAEETVSAQGSDNRRRTQGRVTSAQGNEYGFDNVGTSQFDSELEESARGSGGLRHYIWTPEISGGSLPVERNRHESASSGVDSTREQVGRNFHSGIETDSTAAGQQWYSGSGSSQYGRVGQEEADRRHHGTSHSGSYSWSTVDRSVAEHYGSNDNRDYDTWRRGHEDNVDDSSSSYGHDYNIGRRGGKVHGTGSSVDITQNYGSSSSGYGDAAGQYASGGQQRSGSQQYSSHYEGGTSWKSRDGTVSENKLEGNEGESTGQLKLYRKYIQHSSGEDSKSRQRRNAADADLEQATHCNTTQCSKMHCVLGPLAKGEEVKFAFRFLVWAKTLKSLGYNKPANVSSLVATRLTRLPYIGLPDQVTLRTEEVVTEVVPTDAPLKPEIVPLWIVVLSACAGAVILLLLIFLLWKCGFFKRNRPSNAPEKEPLNRNGHYGPGDEAL